MGLFGLMRRNRKGIGMVPILIVIAIVAVIAVFVMTQKGGEKGTLSLSGIASPSAKTASVSQISTESVPAVLPAGTVAYYTVQNVEEQWKAVTGSNFWKRLTALPFWNAVDIQQTVETFKKDVETGLGFEITQDRVFELIGKEFAFAVLPAPAGAAENAAPQVFFMMRTGMKSKIADSISGLAASQEGNPRLSKTAYNGTDIVFISPEAEGDPEVRYCFAGDILVFGVGQTEDSLKQIVDLSKDKKIADSLAGDANFKQMNALVGGGDNTLGLFFVDMKKVGASIDSLNLMGVSEGQVNISDNIKSLKMIGGRIYGKGEISAKIMVVPDRDNMSADAAKLWDVAPMNSASLGLVPSGSLIFSVSNALDMAAMWKSWSDSMGQAAAGEEMLGAISRFETENDISIQEDILSWVGNEASFVFANVDVTGMFPVPELAFAVKTTDQAKTEAFMAKLLGIINKNLATVGEGVQVDLVDRTYGSSSMKVLQIPVAVPGLMPGYMFKDRFLVVSTSAKVMEQMIDTADGKLNAVSKDANYGALKSVLPAETNQMAYVNLEKFLDSTIEVLRWVIQFQNMQAGGDEGAENEQGAVLEQQVVPAIEVFKTFKSIGMSTVYSDKGVEQNIKVALEDK